MKLSSSEQVNQRIKSSVEVDRRDTDLPCASSGEVNLSSKAVSQLQKNRLRPSTGENDQESEYKL